MWVIDAGDEQWRKVSSQDQPRWLDIRLKFAPTTEGTAVTGARVERKDGRPLTARDLRLVKMPPNWVLFGETPARWYTPGDNTAPVQPARNGARRRDDEHWRAVHAAWLQAMDAAPTAPVKWLLATRRWPVSDATMRRWIRLAREVTAADTDASPK